MVGSVRVTARFGGAVIEDYIAALKNEAAAAGVDGVANVEAALYGAPCAWDCGYGYSEYGRTSHYVKGDAFVWAESTSTIDTARPDASERDSLKQAPARRTARNMNWQHWVQLAAMFGAALVFVVTIIHSN